VYLRVSTSQQTTRSQKPDLERWLNAQDPEKLGKVVWYSDTATGKNMDRPRWQKLQANINAGYWLSVSAASAVPYRRSLPAFNITR
jgi:DNA invertase Pin-like site-specific DNA recombinase